MGSRKPALKTLSVGPLQSNCSVLMCPETKKTALIDPGDDADRILTALPATECEITHVLLTHAHIDHIAAIPKIVDMHTTGSSRPEIYLNKADEELYMAVETQGTMFGLHASPPLPIDHYLEDNQTIAVGNISLKTIFTPGHSPGGVCFFVENPPILFAGDTLFHEGIGRTDVWGGSFEKLKESLQQRLYTLPNETIVIAGHGPNTTIGHEKKNNPFIKA